MNCGQKLGLTTPDKEFGLASIPMTTRSCSNTVDDLQILHRYTIVCALTDGILVILLLLDEVNEAQLVKQVKIRKINSITPFVG